MIENICDIEKCTGCTTCQSVCPTNSIFMREGNGGHLYPSISSSCIDCGKCIKNCPVNKEVELSTPLLTYAAWAKDSEEHATSTSGGVAAVLTNWYLENGGVVYGCASLPKGKIEHVRVAKKSDAYLLKGSKYVQSYIGETLVSVKKDLKAGYKVLFVGLPCQVAGLKNYIGDHPGLVTVDLVCHGVPSQKLLFDYLSEHGIRREIIDEVKFRDSEGFNLTVFSEGKILYRRSHLSDLYYLAFLDNLSFRSSCYTCIYATDRRCGDITLGDFWGLGKKDNFNYKPNGNVSLVLVNSHKGKELIDSTSYLLELVPRQLSEAVAGNPNLRRPSVNNKSNKFREEYQSNKLVAGTLRKYLFIRRIKALIIPIIEQLYKVCKN